jgi:PadR family transcriptional regulator PadR
MLIIPEGSRDRRSAAMKIAKENDEGEEMCDMRGMLSFTILWLLSGRPMYGQELATEIGNRRGDKPNPGTIYPALKDLAARRLIKATSQGRNSVYELTEEGKGALERSMEYFERAFGDIFNELRLAPKEAAKTRARRSSSGGR